MGEKWIYGHAVAQYEGVGAMAPNVSGKTAKTLFRSEADGTAIRFVFEERYSKSPIIYDSITVLINGHFFTLTQNGKKKISIEPGQKTTLDPIEISIKRGTEIELRTYTCSPKTSVSASPLKAMYSLPGDYTCNEFQEASIKKEKEREIANFCGYRGMEVRVSDDDTQIIIAALGDSITAGGQWVEPVRTFLKEKESRYMLMNMGINGNRLLRDTNTLLLGKKQIYGESGIHRMHRDIELIGANVVVLALGINDIGEPSKLPLILPPMKELPTLQQLTQGLNEVVDICHHNRMKVIGCTITPFGGFKTATLQREKIRCGVNGWIRNSGVYDSVADYEAALVDIEYLKKNPDLPMRMRPEFDSGDHLHPNIAGGKAMAERLIQVLEIF
ncbi:MAG: GDSL-type esterase/lipase family protein [Oliverpabstia sp.]